MVLTCICVRLYSVATPAGPSYLALAYRGGGGGALEQLVPVLFADQTAGQHVVPIARYQRCQTLAAHEAFQVKHVQRLAAPRRGRRAASAATHHELGGGYRLAAGAARSRASEQPAGPLRDR